MKKLLQYSKDNKHTIRINTTHPDGDTYDGVVLGISNSIIVFQDASDFAFEGVSILPRKWISSIRDGEFEKTYDKVLHHHGEFKNLSRKKWANEITSIKSAIAAIQTKDIWPAIEAFVEGKEASLFLGPITAIYGSKFTIYAYDATGTWEHEYDIRYSDVFCIQLFNQYTKRFNEYVKSIDKKNRP